MSKTELTTVLGSMIFVFTLMIVLIFKGAPNAESSVYSTCASYRGWIEHVVEPNVLPRVSAT